MVTNVMSKRPGGNELHANDEPIEHQFEWEQLRPLSKVHGPTATALQKEPCKHVKICPHD